MVQLNAATKTSAKSGNWNTASTWSPSGIPTASDDVTIEEGHYIENSMVCNARSIIVDGTLEVTSGSPITASEEFIVNGTVICTQNAINIGADYSISVSTGGRIQYERNDSWTIAGGLIIESGGRVSVEKGTLIVTGNLELAQNATLSFDSGTYKLDVKGTTYCDGRINLEDATGSNSTFTGEVSGTGTIVTGEGRNVIFKATSNDFLRAGGGTLVLNTPNSNMTLPSYNNLTIYNNTNKTFATATVYGNLIIGAPMPLAGNITVKGNVEILDNITGTSKIIFGGTSTQTLGGAGTFSNVEISTGATVSLTSNVTVTTGYVNNGTLICNGYILTANGVAKECTTTEINDAFANASSKVYTKDSSIIVEAKEGTPIEVVNTIGSKVFAGKAINDITVISEKQGLYIVIVDGISTKVLVK